MFYYIIHFQRIKKPPKIPNNCFGALLLDILILYRYWLIIGNSGTPFQKVSAIYCNN